MPAFETNGERTSIEDQKEIAKKMIAKMTGKPMPGELADNGTPFTDDQLTFLAMADRDLLIQLQLGETRLLSHFGRKGRKAVADSKLVYLLREGYNAISSTYDNWKAGKRE